MTTAGGRLDKPGDHVKKATEKGRPSFGSRPPLDGHGVSIHLAIRSFGVAVGIATGSLHNGACADWRHWGARLRSDVIAFGSSLVQVGELLAAR